MCSWERFCTFAREPERRKVGIDARLAVDGVLYQVDPELAGKPWCSGGDCLTSNSSSSWASNAMALIIQSVAQFPAPLPTVQKTALEQRADRIEALADQLQLPKAALEVAPPLQSSLAGTPLPAQPFVDPDPFQELTFANTIAAKKAIADYLALPLAKLPPEQLDFINTLVANTLEKREVMTQVRSYFSVLRRNSPC